VELIKNHFKDESAHVNVLIKQLKTKKPGNYCT
jgi:hypothetical protein